MHVLRTSMVVTTRLLLTKAAGVADWYFGEYVRPSTLFHSPTCHHNIRSTEFICWVKAEGENT